MYLYLAKFDFEIYISKNKDLRILNMYFHYTYSSLGFRGWRTHHLTHCEEWRGMFCAIVVKLFTREFLQVLTSSYINLFKWILYFHYAYLGFRVQQIWHIVHYEEWGGSFVPSLLSFSLESFRKFLQVIVSTCSSGFYILVLAFNF